MRVYIEFVIVDNVVMNVLICLLSCKLMRYQVKYLDISIVSVVGTIVAVLYPYLQFSNFGFLAFRVTVGVVLGTILVFRQTKRILGICVFFLITFALGGAMFAFGFFVHGNASIALKSPTAPVPVGAVVGIGIGLYFALLKIILKLNKSRDFAPFEQIVHVELNGHKFKLNGFVDSGNRLYHKGRPVALLSKEVFRKDLAQMGVLPSERLIVFSLGGNTSIPIVIAQKIVLYYGTSPNILYNVPIGLTENKFDGFDILLPPVALSA